MPALLYTYFNLDDPIVGGNAQEKIALRRAIGLGFNTPEFVRVVQGGDGIPATQLLPPGVDGYDAAVAKRASYDPAAARALLDRFGYVDRDGDGYRELPDGSPLALTQNGTPDTLSRETGNLWITSMKAIGLRMKINSAPFAELLKQANAGQLQVFDLGYRSPSPSGFAILATLWGKASPDTNHSHFQERRLRRRLRAVPAHAAGTGKERGRAPDVRRGGRLRADRLSLVPGGQCVHATMGEGLLPVELRLQLEIRRHRPRQEARSAEGTAMIDLHYWTPISCGGDGADKKTR